MFTVKNVVLCTVSALSVIVLSSCGSKRNATSSAESAQYADDLIERKTFECVRLADGYPNRSWGRGDHILMEIARDYAEFEARQSLAGRMETYIKRCIERGSHNFAFTGTSKDTTNIVWNGVVTKGTDIKEVSEQVIKDAHVIKTQFFSKPNGENVVFVTIEVMRSDKDIADDIANSLLNKFSDEDKIKIDFEMQKFRESFKEEMERYRELKK